MRTCATILLLVVALCGCGNPERKPTSGPIGIGVPQTPTVQTPPPSRTFFVYAKIADLVLPIERAKKYEEPLQAALKAAKLGEVTGGGTALKDGQIEYVGLDIELANLDSAVELTRKKLSELGAPKGSTLKFEKDGRSIELPVLEK